MTWDDLLEHLRTCEWRTTEFKAAQHNVPDSAYESVSAFANTEGGWLIFGASQLHGKNTITGVANPDKIQSDFLSTLRAGQKLSAPISVQEFLLENESKSVLAFYISEAIRQDKPVHLNGNLQKSFIRRGSGDERCSVEDIARFLRDASDHRYDGHTVDLDPEYCFDAEAVKWYRGIFYHYNSDKDQSFSDLEFLHDCGLVIEEQRQLLPTRASLLLFGSSSTIMRILPRPVCDCQWINADWSDTPPEQRWADRLVLETNLIQAWRHLVDRYQQRMEQPFAIDPATLRRDTDPPAYMAFREAAINLLIHQDYGDHTRAPLLQFFRNRTVLWNPGEALAPTDDLIEPGGKEVRNPRIVAAFRRIGLSEQAGTGIRSIYRNWQHLGLVPPKIDNDKARKCFRIDLLKEELLTEAQLLFQAQLGVRLTNPEAAAFALACRQGRIRLPDVKAVTGLAGPRAQAIVDKLETQGLVQRAETIADGATYVLASHLHALLSPAGLSDRPLSSEGTESGQPSAHEERLVSDQPGRKGARLVTDQPLLLHELSDTQWKVIMYCDVPRSMTSIMQHVGVTHRAFFRRTHFDALITARLLQRTHPEQPNHPDQAYVLTSAAVDLKAHRMSSRANADAQERSNNEAGYS